MALQALLVTADPDIYGALSPALQELGILFRTAETGPQVDFFLQGAIFDAIFIDCDGLTNGARFFRDVRLSSSKNCTTFALTNGKTSMKDSFLLGANYVLEKPLTSERLRETLRSAMNVMLRERRRHSRHPLNGTAVIWYEGNKKVIAQTVNISEGGVAVELPHKIEVGVPVRIEFDLPGERHIDAKGEIAWADSATHVGVKLLFMSAGVRHDLDNWLVDRLIESERKQPQFYTPPQQGRAHNA